MSSTMIGKTITEVRNEDNESILILCLDNSAFEMYHNQDCCESVYVHSILGDIENLYGKTVTGFKKECFYEDSDWPEDIDKPSESGTVTIFTIDTEHSSVKIRFAGYSNGYYSESVHFSQTHTPIEVNQDELEKCRWN